jgi:hypothetical protein
MVHHNALNGDDFSLVAAKVKMQNGHPLGDGHLSAMKGNLELNLELISL